MTEGGPMFLSRITLRTDPSAAALAPLIAPQLAGDRTAAAHHLLWSLFADQPDRRRDFLWRDEDAGQGWGGCRFYTLSRRPPVDRHALFRLESREFAPVLAAGDRLRFRLRANPAVARSQPDRQRSRRVDPLAEALRGLSPAERAERRGEITVAVGRSWLDGQGRRAGFRLAEAAEAPLAVDGDDWRSVPRPGHPPIRFSVLEFDGTLVVEDPAVFLARLAEGFGRERTFGCGLMLIRRA
ncbi:type I-E CRISPR-associated protein Cas6/Cse3/CasE [Stella sp.]|uniref:type I-E CRISPR-associated protein Cas6/Cse3/CasE n=1 Tax=Stella sp. TaxID=2912054 RepID=UPI0035ADD482